MSAFPPALTRVSAALLAIVVFIPHASRAEDTIAVTLDRARIVKLPDRTQTLVIGNPIIADVTPLKSNGLMVITGKSYGTTNLIALDASGNPVAESVVRVDPNDNALIVQRGMSRESYACSPRCEPTINLGDEGKYLGDVAGNVKARTALSLPGATAAAR
jgi:Flp pilus assembly secretin CpaC